MNAGGGAPPAASLGRASWPAAIAASAWLVLAAALLAGYSPGGPFDAVLPVVAALPPAALAGFRALRAGRKAPIGRPWLARLVLAAGIVLLLVPLAWELLMAPAAATFTWGGGPRPPATLDAPEVRRFLPGPAEVWTYLAALVLTILATVPPRRSAVATSVFALGVGVLGSGVALAANGAAIGATMDAGAAECSGVLAIPANGPIRSIAWGDLDGPSLGSVAVKGDDAAGALLVRYDTRWARGSIELGGHDPAALSELGATALGQDERYTADDLGIDLAGGLPTRHCQIVIDGHSAVRGFVALRRLSGADERSADPGRGLELWRGVLDYWVVAEPSPSGATPSARLVLAAVAVDGQPPGWPFFGLRATLHAIVWFESAASTGSSAAYSHSIVAGGLELTS